MPDQTTPNLDTQTAKAKEIIALRDREKSRQSNFRSLWQSVANLEFPQTYGIDTTNSAGSELMSGLFDTTAVEESENMANGISNTLFPPGQKFFLVRAEGDLGENEEVSDYLTYLCKKSHEYLADSNFRTQMDNTIHFWGTFGMGVLYSDWTVRDGLNFRDYAIGTYQCLENAKGIIDTIILTCPMTARQIRQQFGDRAGPSVVRALQSPDTSNEEFNVIHVVRPREKREADRIDALNMPFESLYVQEKDSLVLDEGGFEEFPFAVPRYQVIYREVYGRGRGVMLLPTVRQLNRKKKDYDEMCNKWVNPPREVLESFEGNVNVTPGANNYVVQMGSIAPIPMGASGALPITKDLLEYYRDEVRQGFFKSAFEALTPLSGDRRTTLEISERLKEGMKKLGKPISRMIQEGLDPCVTRTILMLIRNGQVKRPPVALQGTRMKIQFVGPLAKALEEYEAKAGEYWVNLVGSAEALFPGVRDNVDSDRWARDAAESLGVNPGIVRPTRQRDNIRQLRLEQRQKEELMAAAQMESDAYGQTTKAPEPGSMAGAAMGGE